MIDLEGMLLYQFFVVPNFSLFSQTKTEMRFRKAVFRKAVLFDCCNTQVSSKFWKIAFWIIDVKICEYTSKEVGEFSSLIVDSDNLICLSKRYFLIFLNNGLTTFYHFLLPQVFLSFNYCSLDFYAEMKRICVFTQQTYFYFSQLYF